MTRIEQIEQRIEKPNYTGFLAKEDIRYLLSKLREQAWVRVSGAGMIAAERARQVSVEGWTPEHDDSHTHCELNEAGRAYARAAELQVRSGSEPENPGIWPWERSWWKPSPDPIRNLVKAGALIAAEIDRLKRLPSPPQDEQAQEGKPNAQSTGESRNRSPLNE